MAADTTSNLLLRGMPALQQESDYELASRALPGSLKTVESFHVAHPANKNFLHILIEAYCQYGSAFVEDEWEQAQFVTKDFDAAAYHAKRATKMFIRCMNYATEDLGSKWSKALSGDMAGLQKVARKAKKSQRKSLMWLALGLTSTINLNLDDIEVVAYLSFTEYLLQRVVIMDGDKHILLPEGAKPDEDPFPVATHGKAVGAPKDKMQRALPHFALGRVHNSRGEALGGNPEQGLRHFKRALELTDGKFLLAKTYLARDYARMKQDRELFHKTLVEVLQTDPAIWPEQRLANEVAHRRARRYLKLEKEWF